jgi:hypothetical protein
MRIIEICGLLLWLSGIFVVGSLDVPEAMIFGRLSRSIGTMARREATHAGSWYSKRSTSPIANYFNVEPELASQLDTWLAAVPQEYNSVKGARVIIAPYPPHSAGC